MDAERRDSVLKEVDDNLSLSTLEGDKAPARRFSPAPGQGLWRYPQSSGRRPRARRQSTRHQREWRWLFETVVGLDTSAKMDSMANLPDSTSPDLHLDHPTADESTIICNYTAASWIDSLTLPLYLEESRCLSTAPLARDGGMTTWILVDRRLAPNERPILSSCESYRKRSLTSDADGNVEDNIVHGIASVFTPSPCRRHGYAARLMTELAMKMRVWQTKYGPCVGTILYSDIGKSYYTKFGWLPNSTNFHLVLPPRPSESPMQASTIAEEDLAQLCQRDEDMVRSAMALPAPDVSRRVTIMPDLDHMLWHIRKEDFATEHIFGEKPRAKGAISGRPGKQVWALWTHRYYGHPERVCSGNVLYILRLVIEGDFTANRARSTVSLTSSVGEYSHQAASLNAVLQAAQAEAAKWKLHDIKLWDPSPLAHHLISNSTLQFSTKERHEESIASGLWYEYDEKQAQAPVWINNEHYAWL